jgi:thymidine phosphorylase
LLRLSKFCAPGTEEEVAIKILESGKAYEKFMAICKAQGGFREPHYAKYRFDVLSVREGTVTNINNRRLARIAKLAGAPTAYRAGLWLNVHTGKKIKKDDLLFSIYAESNGELEYTKEYLNKLTRLIDIE